MNSEGFYVPLTKYEFDDAERSILENLKKTLTGIFWTLLKIFWLIQKKIKNSDHSGKTQFSLENNFLR